MKPEIAKLLREPFAPELVGKLPRVFCKGCRDAQFKVCQQHQRQKCRDCGSNITTAHLHLDYVGHAEITDRLLLADVEWAWEPVAFGPDGLPLLDRNGGLWIRLSVAGVTRIGYGHADGKSGPDAVKEAIGDALRNAAMRFGVALDLWGAKFKDSTEEQPDEPDATQPTPRQNILANAEKAITASPLAGLPALAARTSELLKQGAITPTDAEDLAGLIEERRVELGPAEDRTAEPGQADLGGDWPESARPGNPT